MRARAHTLETESVYLLAAVSVLFLIKADCNDTNSNNTQVTLFVCACADVELGQSGIGFGIQSMYRRVITGKLHSTRRTESVA